MNQVNNNILPAIRNIKDLEKLIKTDYKMCVLLDMHRYAYRTYKKYYGIAEAKSYRVFYSYRFDKRFKPR
ncbi:hypothetical protein SA59458_12480 [Staphylococcus aureus]|nr:hypothetical protein SA59458_12480 [Staphylococcus aureus]